MESITLRTPDISCAHCEAAISTAVKKLEGVDNVKIDLSAKLVTVAYDAQKLTVGKIKETIEGQGYNVE